MNLIPLKKINKPKRKPNNTWNRIVTIIIIAETCVIKVPIYLYPNKCTH